MNSSEIKIIADSVIERIRSSRMALEKLQNLCNHDTTEAIPPCNKPGLQCTACRKVLINGSSGW